MPLIQKVGEVEIYEIDKDLSKYTRKEREGIVNVLFKISIRQINNKYFIYSTKLKEAS